MRAATERGAFWYGFAAGMTGIVGGCVLLAAALVTTGEAFTEVAALTVAAHIPVAFAEGLVTGFLVSFLRRVKPELLEAPVYVAIEEEKADA